MDKVLDYFSIEGAVGGSQEWFRNVVMHIGGCAAATACDCCIYLALHRGLTKLYPYDVHMLTKRDYINFSMKMKPYLRPRVNGVNKLWMFTEGLGHYLSDMSERHISMEEFFWRATTYLNDFKQNLNWNCILARFQFRDICGIFA